MGLTVGCSADRGARYIQDLNSENPKVRDVAAFQLGRHRNRNAVPSLIVSLGSEPSKGTRLKIIQALGDIGSTQAVATLVATLQSDAPDVREAAVVALGKIRSRDAIPDLVALMDDPEMGRAAVWALGHSGCQEAVPALIPRLTDSDRYGRYLAGQALKEIGRED